MMNEMMTNNGVGSQAQKLLQEIKSLLDQNQRDIVNRNITPETLNRQNMIVTRMLEAENSENQREVDPKRESKEVVNQTERNVKPLDIDFKKDKSYSELLSRSQMSLGTYYRKKYKEYLIKINE